MTGWVVGSFAGARKVPAPRLLENNEAQHAENARLDDGNLRPWADTAKTDDLAKTGPIETIWRYEGSYWFQWAKDVDVVDGPVPNDTEARTYYTGDGAPKMTYSSIATAGASQEYPTNYYELGIPAPSGAPSVSVSGTANDPNDIAEDRSYVYTYVSGKGEEGPPSPVSAQVSVKPGQTVDVTNMDTAPTGNYNVTHKRIYRTATSGGTTEFQFVAEIDVATTSYNDAVDTDDLGEVLPSAEWDAPPDDLQGLIALPNGILAGFRANEVCFSEPYLPHAWPTGYRLQTDADIVAIGAFGSSVAVATKGNPYIASGVHPSAMSLTKLEAPYACVSKRSLVDMGYSVLYAAPEGLVEVSSEGAKLITARVFTPEQWQAYQPSSMHAYRFRGRYLAFYDTGSVSGGLFIEPGGAGYVELGFHATAGWLDAVNDKLYLVRNGTEVHEFDAGSDLSYTWRSREFRSARPINPAIARVEADAYPVTFTLDADGSQKASVSVPDDEPFMLPGGYLAQRFVFELSGTPTVRKVELAESVEELRSG